MSKTRNLRPGGKVPRSGQYQQTGPRGGQGKEVTSVKGERLRSSVSVSDTPRTDNEFRSERRPPWGVRSGSWRPQEMGASREKAR